MTLKPLATLFALSLSATVATSATVDAKPKQKTSLRCKAPAKKVKGECVSPSKKAKTYDFSGDDVNGERLDPNESRVYAIEDKTRPSLIRLRINFFPEIYKSAESI